MSFFFKKKAFCKIYLHHQAFYETNNVTEFTSATKLRIKIKNYFKITTWKEVSFVNWSNPMSK